MTFSSKDVEIISQQLIYEGFTSFSVVDLKFRRFKEGWSNVVTREVFKKKQAVGVLLFDPLTDEIILTEQFRVGTLEDKSSPWQVEVVAGIIEPSLTPEDTVHKEVLEETTLSLMALEPIVKYWLSPGSSNEFFYLYCGCVNSKNMPEYCGLQEEDEDIRLTKIKAKIAFEQIYSDVMNNAATIISLQWMQNNHARLSKKWNDILK